MYIITSVIDILINFLKSISVFYFIGLIIILFYVVIIFKSSNQSMIIYEIINNLIILIVLNVISIVIFLYFVIRIINEKQSNYKDLLAYGLIIFSNFIFIILHSVKYNEIRNNIYNENDLIYLNKYISNTCLSQIIIFNILLIYYYYKQHYFNNQLIKDKEIIIKDKEIIKTDLDERQNKHDVIITEFKNIKDNTDNMRTNLNN